MEIALRGRKKERKEEKKEGKKKERTVKREIERNAKQERKENATLDLYNLCPSLLRKSNPCGTGNNSAQPYTIPKIYNHSAAPAWPMSGILNKTPCVTYTRQMEFCLIPTFKPELITREVCMRSTLIQTSSQRY